MALNSLWLFLSTFVLVFALGMQSLNVNGGHYKSAFFTSFLIGASNLALFKIAPDATLVESIGFLAGGPLGIISSMAVHKRIFKTK